MQRPRCFYYITHIDRLKSILKEGILSRNQLNTWNRFLQKVKKIRIWSKNAFYP